MLLDREINVNVLFKDEETQWQIIRILEDIKDLSDNSEGSTVVGVFGDWGTGKTSVLKALYSFYKDYCEFPTVFYEAWKHQNDEDYLLSLISKIDNAGLDKRGKEKVKNLIAIGKRIAFSSMFSIADIFLRKTVSYSVEDVVKIMKMVEESQTEYISHYDEYLKKFREILEKLAKNRVIKNTINKDFQDKWNSVKKIVNEKPLEKKLVLIIDDLDRLVPENAFKIIETLRFYFDAKNLIVIMGVNDKILENFVKERFHYKGDEQEFSEKFLEKIFHYTINLSTSPINDIHLRNFDEDSKKKLLDIFEQLELTLPHRKWIKILNRIYSKSRGIDEFDYSLILKSLLEELYPKFEYFYRRYPYLKIKAILEENYLEVKEKRAFDEIKKDKSFLIMPEETFEKIKRVFSPFLKERGEEL